MHSGILKLRRFLAWPLGDSGWATVLQGLIVLYLAIWAALSMGNWMTQTAHDWQPVGLELTITGSYPLPAGLASVDFDVAESVNPQVGARTLDPAKTRYGVSQKKFIQKAGTRSLHTVWLEKVNNNFVRVHYFVQNPGDTAEYYRMYPVEVPPIVFRDKGRYLPSEIDTDADKVEELRAFEVTYKFEQSASVGLAQALGENVCFGWLVAFFATLLAYAFLVRPAHLGFSKWVYAPVPVTPSQPQTVAPAETELIPVTELGELGKENDGTIPAVPKKSRARRSKK